MRIPSRKRPLDAAIRSITPASRLLVPLDGLRPMVEVGERVRAGQLIGAREDGAVRHTAWSGKVVDVNNWVVVEGGPEEPLLLRDGNVVEIAREAGLVGMGGAAFPTFRKFELTQSASLVLINGCESEPFVTCDSAVLAEAGDKVSCGMRLAMNAVGASDGRIIADENQVGYPGGYEGLLAGRVLGVNLGIHQRPSDLGVLVINVQTAHALCVAVCQRRPLLERVVTVDGEAVGRPGNYRVAIGTPVAHLLAAAEVDLVRAATVLIGGSMMGRRADLHEPIGPGCIAVLALSREQTQGTIAPEEPCLRCGRCEEVCPFALSACLLIESPDETIQRCVECGACQFACPSHRPLVGLLHEERQRLRGLSGGPS